MVAVTLIVSLLLSAAELVSSSPVRARSEYAVKDTHFVPRKWARAGPAPADHIVNLKIGLVQSKFYELERHLYEVSDPAHHRYGQHLSEEEIHELIKPSIEAHDLVHEWLDDNGVESHKLEYSPAKDWIHVSLPISAIERLLDTEYSVYEHEEGGHVVRTPEWSLPRHLHEHITTIQPTNSFFRATPRKSLLKPVSDLGTSMADLDIPSDEESSVAKVCNTSSVTPKCLRTYYGTINYTPQAPKKNLVGLNDFLGESNNRSDTKIFLEHYRKDAVSAAETFEVVVINHGSNQQTPNTKKQTKAGRGLEGNLDVETILGIDYPTQLIAFTTGGSPPFNPDKLTPTDTNEPYMTWLDYVLNKQSPIPQTISTSYGDDEQTVPLSYADAVCKQFAQLGARGVSLLFASGDNGVGADGDCYSNTDKTKRMFLPSFPDGCPYVTSVGATKNFAPEVAAYDPANKFASGGGFANYFGRPSYQDKAVTAYLKTLGTEFEGLYNKSGRAYPDISAQGQRFITVWEGQGVLLDGTSASTPTASAIIALVNDALIASGHSPLGFLNPLIYAAGNDIFHDIVSGSGRGCDTLGFPTTKGWDPVTGYGTPKFTAMKSHAMSSAKRAVAKRSLQ